MSTGTMAGCRHQDSNLGRTNHTALNRARSTTLAWRRNSRIANVSANHFGTQRRESDLNTRVLADAAVPAQSLDQAREIPPTVRRRVELRSLAALGFKPSAVAYPHVSLSPSEPCSDEPASRCSPGRRNTHIAHFLTLSFEVNALISTQSRQGWMTVTLFRGSTRRRR